MEPVRIVLQKISEVAGQPTLSVGRGDGGVKLARLQVADPFTLDLVLQVDMC
jgi:hypothetical protein